MLNIDEISLKQHGNIIWSLCNIVHKNIVFAPYKYKLLGGFN